MEEVRTDEEMNISSLAYNALSEINLCQAVLWCFLYFLLLSFFFLSRCGSHPKPKVLRWALELSLPLHVSQAAFCIHGF